MAIEDITTPRVVKFLFDVSDCKNGGKVKHNGTGAIVRFLDAKLQEDNLLTLWAEEVPSCLGNTVECFVACTGDNIPPREYQYVSTAQDSNGLVYHIYAKSLRKFRPDI